MPEAAFWNRVRDWPGLPIAALVLLNLLIGLLVVRDYGMSTDEPKVSLYAAHSLRNYQRVLEGSSPVDFANGYLDYYGPAFFMAARLFARFARNLPITWTNNEASHFSYFITFQIALISLYFICRRWMTPWAAFGAVLLFETQPVLWGHAFINPKDVPFMAGFLASLALGFRLGDRTAKLDPFPEVGRPLSLGIRELSNTVAGPFVLQILRGFGSPNLLFAAFVLGLTTSVRLLGPYAGVIVVLYALSVCPRRIPGLVVPYALVAALTSYLTWPFLWRDPLIALLNSFLSMSRFPWLGDVLFEGRIVAATDLPARYLAKMMGLQFTEPAILLFIAGTGLAAWKMLKEKMPEPFTLLAAWLLVPLLVIILAGSTVYDGFRQVFFLVPPIFICAGLALDWVFQRVRPVVLRTLLLALVIAPGVYWIVSLHPYEYIYYNSFVGGVRGAFRNYELDFWGTSFREAANYVNGVAPPNAQVVVYGQILTYSPYARPDLRLLSPTEARRLRDKGRLALKYAVISARQNRDLAACSKAETVKTIERDGAILVVVKKIPTGQTSCQD